jgi:Holliday junction resolvase
MMGDTQRRAKNRGRANEVDLAADLYHRGFTSAKRVPLSGALHEMPGDVTVEELNLLIEAKVYATEEISGARYFKIDLNWLWKIFDEAKRIGWRNACVVIRGKHLRRRAVLMDYAEYLALVRDAEAYRHTL